MYIVTSRIRQPDARGRRPLLASASPAEHIDYGLAVGEAKRLAEIDRSRDYYVYKAVACVGQKEAPVEVNTIE